MLKVKKNNRVHINKEEAMSTVLKEEVKRLNADIPKSQYNHFKSKLAKDDMSISKWVRVKVNEYLG